MEQMTFDLANAGWMYGLGAFVCIFVLVTSCVFIVKAKRDADRLGMDPKILRKTAVTGIVFSVLPSVSILIGVIALSGTIGIPLPWIRLSVIGALHYEQTAVAAAYPGITMAAMTQQQFVTIATVMTIGILSGPIFCFFGLKQYDKKILIKAKQNNNGNNEKKAKRSFGPILFSSAFIALICSFLAEEFAKLKNVSQMDAINPKTGQAYGKLGSFTPLIVIIVAFGMMALIDLISKKFKLQWLNDFAIGISMLAGMASAMLVELLL